jgi:hypothetical protein
MWADNSNGLSLSGLDTLVDCNKSWGLELGLICQLWDPVVECLSARGLYLAVPLRALMRQSSKGFGRMRNALVILSLGSVFALSRLAVAGPVDFAPTADTKTSQPENHSAYASVLTTTAFSDSRDKDSATNRELLPVNGSDLPLPSAVSNSTGSSGSPQASVVEAIPTPTAFHAGVFLLIAMFTARYFRKLRVS